MAEDALGGDGVVGPEVAGEGFRQRRDLWSHLALGQVGEALAVALAGDEGFDHGPPRLGQHLRRDRREHDPGVLEHR